MRFLSIATFGFAYSFISAFQPHHHSTLKRPSAQSVGPLNVGATLDWNSFREYDEDETAIMDRAHSCADSDSCPLDEARFCLDNVIRVQSNCASGALVGSSVCEEADTTAEIVAQLRRKIAVQKQLKNLSVGASTVLGSGFLLLILAAASTGMSHLNPEVSVFTPQEWWWSIRDGYFPNMLAHYFRHGGLTTVNYESETTPLVLQEWWWAIQGGYVDTVVEHFFKNGGLSAVARSQGMDVSPMTPQEWIWSIKHGYFYTILAHNFEHGGLATGDLRTDTLPFTPQEWFWASRDGYLGDLIQQYYQNGGL